MKIDGVYYTEPELTAKFRQMQATIDRYEAENRKLTEEKEELGGLYNDASLGIGYLEQRCEELEKREKEYKRLLKEAVEDIRKLGDNGNGCLYTGACVDCPLYKDESSECRCWNRETEALDLIGETND